MPPEDADANPGAGAIQILHELDVRPDDGRTLVAVDDPVVVHRYIELHRERLAERPADQLRALLRLEGTLNQAILNRRSSSLSSRWISQEVSDGTH